jgi:hypothetical protein
MGHPVLTPRKAKHEFETKTESKGENDMDEIKKQWAKIVPHKFWILSGFVLLASAIVFYLTSSSLSEEITKRFGVIKGKFAKINEIEAASATHPNQLSQVKMNSKIKEMEQDALKAWALQYDRQRDLLTWPKGAFAPFSEAKQIFDNLRPFEKFVKFPAKDDDPVLVKITANDRNVYKQYIAPEFLELTQIIGTQWKAKLGDAAASTYGGAAAGNGTPNMSASSGSEANDLVRWPLASQQELQKYVVPWYDNGGPPSVFEIYYTQEDLWLIKGIMKIIASTNAQVNAKENFQAIIKEIEFIRLGMAANREAGALFNSTAAMSGGGGSSAMGGGGPPAGYGGGSSGAPQGYGGNNSRGEQMSTGGSTRKAVSLDPADNRYVDSAFKTMKGAELRSALEVKDASQAVKGVAKRIPVRLRLKIDPTKLHVLITECGNAQLTLEVYQVRFNTPAAEAVAGGSGGGGGGGSDQGSRPSLGGMGGGSGAGMMGEGPTAPAMGTGSGSGDPNSAMSEVPVEIFGLIYLYNMPADLGKKKPASNPTATSPAASVPAANVPATPPPTTTGDEGQ